MLCLPGELGLDKMPYQRPELVQLSMSQDAPISGSRSADAICECEPVRDRNDYSRPVEYMHAATCPVAEAAEASTELA